MNKPEKMKSKTKYDKCAYAMIFPAYFVFAVFILVPIGFVIYYSLTNFNLYSVPEFVGFKNYLNLFQDGDFLISVRNTLFYTVFTLFPQLAIGLFFAIMLYRRSRMIPFSVQRFICRMLCLWCVCQWFGCGFMTRHMVCLTWF